MRSHPPFASTFSVCISISWYLSEELPAFTTKIFILSTPYVYICKLFCLKCRYRYRCYDIVYVATAGKVV